MIIKVERVTRSLPSYPGEEDAIRFTVKYKHYWWQRWKYIQDDSIPRLFEKIKDINEYLNNIGHTFKNYYAVYSKI